MAKSIIVTPHFCYQLLNYCDKTPWTKTRIYFSIQFHITVLCQRKPGQELKLSRRLEAKTMEEKTAASCLLPRPGTTRLLTVPRTTSAGVAFAHSELGSHTNHQSRKFTMGPYFFFLNCVCVCRVLACTYMWRSEGQNAFHSVFWGRVCHILWLTEDRGSQPFNARVTGTCVKLCHTWLRFASEIYF